jgi:hypothetical protein
VSLKDRLIVAANVARHCGSLVARRPARLVTRVSWEDRGPTPESSRRFTPQGLAWIGGRLIFANSWMNQRSRVYEINPATMLVQRWFDMPAESVHTSGLAWDGGPLWAVDYISNRCHAIELEASFAAGRAVTRGEFATTLAGTSACCVVPWRGERLLAISDYSRTRRTILVRPAESLAAGVAAGQIVFAYRNEGFSQGLEFARGSLFESENKFGGDVINELSVERLAATGDSRRATVAQHPAPGRGVEDLAWDGERMWTSDETVFRFFRAHLPMPPT